MKQLRLLALALAATTFAASLAFASPDDKTAAAGASDCCGAGKKTTATAAAMKSAGANKACSAAMAAQCTPAMSAACAKTTTAGASCPMHGTSATAAMSAKTAAMGDHFAMHGTTAIAASAGTNCAMHGTSAKSAAKTASAGGAKDCCMDKSTTAAAGDHCGMHGTTAAMAAGTKCEAHKMANHSDCGTCADIASCDDDVRATGAHEQVVSLKNGAMVVYTAENAEAVRSLQQAVARHQDMYMAALKGDGKLCADCKQLRGALASGKMTREIVNINSGCQVLITSSDRSIVEKIHAMTVNTMAARVKS